MDDIFFIWRGSKDELEVFVWHLNGVEFKINFTLNHEKDNFIPFLDVGIPKKANRLTTNVYRKPTHTQQYINWNSNHPKNLLLGVMKGLIHRAHILCDEKEDLMEELCLLRNVFILNGYPVKLVKECYDVLHAPYVKGFSEGLQRKLRKFNIGYVPKRGETLHTHLCKL